MKKILSFLLVLACSITTIYAQNIYGLVVRNKTYFGQYSYHSDVLTKMMDPWLGASATTNLGENYYYFTDISSGGNPATLYTYNVVSNTTTQIDVRLPLYRPEYDDDEIWSIDGFCMYSCDIATGNITEYDSVFRKLGEGSVPPFIYSTAFNHTTKTYYFNMCVVGNCDSYTFCQYHIPTKTLTKQALPRGFNSFDYSPTSNRCFFLKNSDPVNSTDTGAGIYAYDMAANTMTQVYNGWVPAAARMTIDPDKNRIFFQYYSDYNNCRRAQLGCYRINSHQLDIKSLDYRLCYYELYEFLPTYNDTTWDGFPQDVAAMHTAKEGVQIYPNPAADVLHVIAATAADIPLYLTDMMGRTMLKYQLQKGKADINTSTLPAGQYILRVGTNSSMVSVVH